MNRVLLDTNVVLDFLLDRAPFADPAAMLWQAGDAGRLVIYVSIITPINVFYIARKLKGSAEARQMTASLLASSRICCPTHYDLQGALALQLTDFEDAVQVVSATVESLDAIITPIPATLQESTFRSSRLTNSWHALTSLKSAKIRTKSLNAFDY